MPIIVLEHQVNANNACNTVFSAQTTFHARTVLPSQNGTVLTTPARLIAPSSTNAKLAQYLPHHSTISSVRLVLKDTQLIPQPTNATVFVETDISPHSNNATMATRIMEMDATLLAQCNNCLLYTSPSPRDLSTSRMPSSA